MNKDLWRAVSICTGKNEYNDSVPPDMNSTILNSYFANIGSSLTNTFNNSSPLWKGPSSIYTFHFQNIDLDLTKKLLGTLSNKSNIDILKFDSKLLSISSNIICFHICTLFNMSISQSVVPLDWNRA